MATNLCRFIPPFPNPFPPLPTLPPNPINFEPGGGRLEALEPLGTALPLVELEVGCDLVGADELGWAPQLGNIFFI